MKLWQQLVSFLNLVFAFEQASKGKRSKVSVSAFEKNLEENLFFLQSELVNGTYRPGDYVNFCIYSRGRKKREGWFSDQALNSIESVDAVQGSRIDHRSQSSIGVGAPLGAETAGDFAMDNRMPQSTLAVIIGRRDIGAIQEHKQMLPMLQVPLLQPTCFWLGHCTS